MHILKQNRFIIVITILFIVSGLLAFFYHFVPNYKMIDDIDSINITFTGYSLDGDEKCYQYNLSNEPKMIKEAGFDCINEYVDINDGCIFIAGNYDSDNSNESPVKYLVINLNGTKKIIKLDFFVEGIHLTKDGKYLYFLKYDNTYSLSTLCKLDIADETVEAITNGVIDFCICDTIVYYISQNTLYSIDDNNTKAIIKNEDFINIESYNNSVFVSTTKGIYSVDLKKHSLTFIENSKELILGTVINNDVMLAIKPELVIPKRQDEHDSLKVFTIRKEKHYLITSNGDLSKNIKALNGFEMKNIYSG